MKVNFFKIKYMEKVGFASLMGKYTQENFLIIKFMVMGFLYGQIKKLIEVTIKKEKEMVKVQ